LRLGTEASPSRPRVLPLGALAMLLLLLVQFLVGMFVNLFVGIPPSHPGASDHLVRGAVLGVAWAVAGGGPALAFHTAIGFLLTIGAVALLAVAILSGRRRAVVATTAVGLLGVLGAGLNGIGFLNYGADKATYLMSVGFSVAVAAYVAALFFAGQPAFRRLVGAGRQAAGG
jgi:hypothetical protein